MSLLQRGRLAFKAVKELGLESLWHYAGYQAKLRSGWLRWQTPVWGQSSDLALDEPRILVQPAGKRSLRQALGDDGEQQLYKEANQMLQGKVRLFGGEPRPLDLKPEGREPHWSHYHSHLAGGGDIKPLWEAGRFGWATVLARAYWLSDDERYAAAFWEAFEDFVASNPANAGPHWSSAQEVALRLIAWAFCYSLLAESPSSTKRRKHAMAHCLAQHAERIPPTLGYAIAQNNNHLASEALGLVTAAALLPKHPRAARWKQQGQRLFEQAVRKQVHADGAYAQHSSNYQRLLLQLGAWAAVLARGEGSSLPQKALQPLVRANDWLVRLVDPDSGGMPNLGPNDGAYILPLTVLPFSDYRPALQAAAAAFGQPAPFGPGPWDELSLWLGLTPIKGTARPASAPLRLEGQDSWAYLRAAHFAERPGHADQLHLDLWWRGQNLACDAGTYLYTAPPPWDNALAGTRLHNTLTVNGQDQMTRAGRFLWLDWAQARILESGRDFAIAEHDGYRRQGVIHRRELRVQGHVWTVTDHLLPAGDPGEISAELHWLMPDLPWTLNSDTLRLKSGSSTITLALSSPTVVKLSLFRAGQRQSGPAPDDPRLGWVSPTYGERQPALALWAAAQGTPPFTITSVWTLPH